MEEAATGNLNKNCFESYFFSASTYLSVLTVFMGFMVLVGWMFNIDQLKSIGSGFITMKANTALAFMFLGTALALINGAKPGKAAYRIGFILAAAAVLLASLNLAEYIFRVDLYIDQCLFKDAPGAAGTIDPGRMAPNTAVNFIAFGIAILLLDIKNKWLFSAGRALAVLAVGITLMALIGYCYGVTDFTGFQGYTKMAVYTSIAFTVLFTGIIFARPGGGIMAEISADNPGGILLRSAIPGIIVILFVLGWLRVAGEARGYYGSYYGASLFTIIRIIVFLILAWVVSIFVNNLHNDLVKKEKELKETEEKFTEIKELGMLKSQFIAVISHELRTPLTIIKGFSSFLNRETTGALNIQQKDFVGLIEHNANRLGYLISEMTDISRIESGILPIMKKPCSLKGMIYICINDLREAASLKQITVESSIEPANLVMYLDNDRMEQAIINLISNAIKFSRQSGRILVEAKYPYTGALPENIRTKIRGNGDCALIRVTDNGEGIDKQNISKVFDKFFQAEEHTTRQHQGMGLGLFIARNIVKGHGGDIWCESEGKGKGAVFFLLLPDNYDENEVRS